VSTGTADGTVTGAKSPRKLAILAGTVLAMSCIGSIVTVPRKVQVNRIKTASVIVLLTSFVALPTPPAHAQERDRRDRYEDRWDRKEDRRDRREDRRDRREDRRDRLEDRWDRREDRSDRREDRYDARGGYWDAARYYRQDNRRDSPRRLGRNDRIYRGSDNRYYCRRDDGTTGLIIGGVGGGVLGHIIAPGGSKTLGTIIGAGAGALIGRAIDDGDVVCR
jgi:Glycine zipper 2TM domain